METEDKLIKEYLQDKARNTKMRKTANCPDNETLLGYLRNTLDKQKRQEIENHIAECSFCLNQISTAYEALNKSFRKGLPSVPEKMINKTKASLGIIDKSKKNSAKSKAKRWFFLSGTIIFFILSFLIPKYFLQFLAGAIIMGIRWSFESQTGQILVMVLDSWRRHSHNKDEQISNRLKDHLKK